MTEENGKTGPDEQDETRHADEGGQRSEVGNLEDAGVVFPEDAVAGYPLDDDEGGAGIQEGAAGPNARTGNEDLDREVEQ
ncbi:hypothetical protein ASE01_07040 [Nocardioides sp. Root190]|uniref:hypothetical protein n=1 Tax=Nocardioides sp. Root190 TaxID=1736488 RepID=UPI00070038D6|nr:hypothetical protein [Nocardioides sp. Root190]KRB77928.1 hypothetical protein ASE01_07040 [Nocardioides sp. Root190]